ncbi:unnamed protein product [Clavelina lepadiformis]|uniref:Uncharacterized protein n=1 Tax=Clavelina lepadiformis TaxID=159417 RepID=A0ABP0H4F3_CLALP
MSERCQKADVQRALPFQTNLSPTGKLASAGSDFLTYGDEMLGEWSDNKETEMAIEEKKRERKEKKKKGERVSYFFFRFSPPGLLTVWATAS